MALNEHGIEIDSPEGARQLACEIIYRAIHDAERVRAGKAAETFETLPLSPEESSELCQRCRRRLWNMMDGGLPADVDIGLFFHSSWFHWLLDAADVDHDAIIERLKDRGLMNGKPPWPAE